jgi:hypothetical protein
VARVRGRRPAIERGAVTRAERCEVARVCVHERAQCPHEQLVVDLALGASRCAPRPTAAQQAHKGAMSTGIDTCHGSHGVAGDIGTLSGS